MARKSILPQAIAATHIVFCNHGCLIWNEHNLRNNLGVVFGSEKIVPNIGKCPGINADSRRPTTMTNIKAVYGSAQSNPILVVSVCHNVIEWPNEKGQAPRTCDTIQPADSREKLRRS